jgi:hypothetical protein
MVVITGDPLTSNSMRDVELVVRGGYAFSLAEIRID